MSSAPRRASSAPRTADVEYEPLRVGSLEGACSPAKRCMPLMRVPGARVAVLAPADPIWESLHAMLANDLTTVVYCDAASDLATVERPDIVVVDRTTIHDGGLELRRIRQQWLTSVIIVTGAADEADAEQLMNIGADDAMIDGDQLLAARLRAAARRARTMNASLRIAIGDIIFDRESRRVWCAGREIRLTRMEEAMLDCLFWYAPRAATMEELMAFARRRSASTHRLNTVQVYIGYLRDKLSESRQVVIRTVRGTGYQFAERDAHRED